MARKDPLLALLKDVSRSFFLSIALLPKPVRRQIAVAYLLARASDTIADSGEFASRVSLLNQFQNDLAAGSAKTTLDIGEATPGDLASLPSPPCRMEQRVAESRERRRNPESPSGELSRGERVLMQHLNEVFSALNEFDAEDQRLIREVIETITSGQLLDIQRFRNATEQSIVALQTAAETDDYTFRVAGCVGLFWTKLCRRHLFSNAISDEAALLRESVDFGKGLQWVNILRDLPKDLRNGRCYLPHDNLAAIGLQPSELRAPENIARFRAYYSQLLGLAASKLDAGSDYILRLPFGQLRLRLACALPILIGQQTLAKLAQSNVLDASQRIKITRSEVRSILVRATLTILFPPIWRRLLKPDSRG